MSVSEVHKTKLPMDKKTRKRILAIVLIIAVLGGGAFYWQSRSKAKLNTGQSLQTAVAKKGDISVKVSGSGPLASGETSDITPKSDGTVTMVYFKEGDTIKAGDLMYELDDSDARLDLEKVRVSVAQAQLESSSNLSDIGNLKAAAPFSGQVSNIQVKTGDVLNKNGNMLRLTDKTNLKLTVPFNSADAAEISPGMKAVVHVKNLMQSVEGTVTYVSNASFSTDAGGKLFNVEIDVKNPGSLKDGMEANAEINTKKGIASSTDNGTLAFKEDQEIKTSTGGTVTKVNVTEGQYVAAGQTLVEFENNDLIKTRDSNEIKLMELNAQLKDAEDNLGNYRIYAPIDGTIVSQDVKAGDFIKSGAVISKMANREQLECSVSIDELDIAKIRVGQKANIIVDALEETTEAPLEGEVTNIAVQGTSSNGVTTYPVTVKVLNTENLRIGMNVNAEILIEDKADVLIIPIEAVTKAQNKSYVTVMSGSGAVTQKDSAQIPAEEAGKRPVGESGQRAAAGTTERRSDGNGQRTASNNATSSSSGNSNGSTERREVVTGVHNETHIEIVEGLLEGETVVLPAKTTGTASSQNQQGGGMQMRGGFMGGGGAPPGGR